MSSRAGSGSALGFGVQGYGVESSFSLERLFANRDSLNSKILKVRNGGWRKSCTARLPYETVIPIEGFRV